MKIIERIDSTDGMATKYLQQTDDGYLIETAYVNYYNKHIICFSSLIGCPIGCKFCISGHTKSYIRPLDKSEIIVQCTNVLDEIRSDDKPVLFSAMGEGEPFLNFKNLIASFSEFQKISPGCKRSVSTSGYDTRRIKELALIDPSIKLQFSLHSTYDKVRKTLIPVSQPLIVIHHALKTYSRFNPNIEINYICIDGVNDSVRDAQGIKRFISGTEWKVKINRFNSFPGIPYQQSKKIKLFIRYLKYLGVDVEYYETNGTDVGGACGQMSYSKATACFSCPDCTGLSLLRAS